MFAIIGAAGNVGYSTASALRQSGLPVRAIVHDEAKAHRLKELGCDVVAADIQQAGALAKAIEGVEILQIVVPLRPPNTRPRRRPAQIGRKRDQSSGRSQCDQNAHDFRLRCARS